MYKHIMQLVKKVTEGPIGVARGCSGCRGTHRVRKFFWHNLGGKL